MTTTHDAQLRAKCTPNATYVAHGAHPRDQIRTDIVTGVGTGDAVDHALFGGVPAARFVDDGGIVAVRVYY